MYLAYYRWFYVQKTCNSSTIKITSIPGLFKTEIARSLIDKFQERDGGPG